MSAIPDHIAQSRYPAIRLASRCGAIHQTDVQLREDLTQLFPDASPEEVENFMRTLKKIGKQLEPVARQVVPIVARAAPGALQGAMAGMVAGPKGALVGAGIGAVASVLASPPSPSRPARPAAPSRPATAPPQARPPAVAAAPAPQSPAPVPVPVQQAPVAAPQPAAPVTPVAQAPAQPGGAPAQAAIAGLLAILSRPETIQALSSLMMGRKGRRRVRVGDSTVPVAAFANAISELAGEAASLAEPISASHAHAFGHGESTLDIANPRARAYDLLRILTSGVSQ